MRIERREAKIKEKIWKRKGKPTKINSFTKERKNNAATIARTQHISASKIPKEIDACNKACTTNSTGKMFCKCWKILIIKCK